MTYTLRNSHKIAKSKRSHGLQRTEIPRQIQQVAQKTTAWQCRLKKGNPERSGNNASQAIKRSTVS